MKESGLTIGRLARAADVGIETIRYYQRRNLLPIPDSQETTFRHYPLGLVDRIRFIKRAQDLGFSLEEISALLQLEDGMDRKSIRKVANERLGHIRSKIANLQRMETVLAHLIHECEVAGHTKSCPIIAALAGDQAEASCHV